MDKKQLEKQMETEKKRVEQEKKIDAAKDKSDEVLRKTKEEF
jgi:hypothetical protein